MAADSPRRRRKVPLVVSIFSIMFTAVLSVALALTAYTQVVSTEATEAIARKLLAQTSEAVATRIERHLLPAASLADLASALPAAAQPPDLLVHPIGWQLMRAVAAHHSVYSAYIGFEDGRFYQIISLDAVEGRARAAHSSPSDARYLQRAIVFRADGGRMQVWSYLGADRRLIDSRVDAEADYDPRSRPWYTKAMAADGQIRTALYNFHSLGLPGFSLAQRFDGDIPGVFGVDVTFEDLSRFLDSVLPTPHSRMAVFDPAGNILAAPGYNIQVRTAASGEINVAPADLHDPVMAELIRKALGKSGDPSDSRSADGRYLTSVAAIDAGPAAQLQVALISPVSDFVAALETMRDRELMFVGLFLVVGVPIVYFVARYMSDALVRLADEAGRIQRLDLEGDPEVKTFVKEINTLACAVATMKTSLRTFSVYVPKDLVSQILTSGGQLGVGGVRRELTVMFSDVEGFTALSEHCDPEDLMRWTSSLFQEISDAVSGHQGVVDKYIGDGVMAIWNAPMAVAGHPARACRAALEADQRVRLLCERMAGQGFPRMNTRFGVHTGEAVVGNVGSLERMNYTALGKTVNTASRLEGLNKLFGSRILVSGETARAAGDAFVFRLLDVVVPLGSRVPLHVHELVGLAPDIEDEDLPRASHDDLEFCRRFDSAQELLHRERDFARAAAAFALLARERPHDRAAAQMATRASELAGSSGADVSDLAVMRNK